MIPALVADPYPSGCGLIRPVIHTSSGVPLFPIPLCVLVLVCVFPIIDFATLTNVAQPPPTDVIHVHVRYCEPPIVDMIAALPDFFLIVSFVGGVRFCIAILIIIVPSCLISMVAIILSRLCKCGFDMKFSDSTLFFRMYASKVSTIYGPSRPPPPRDVRCLNHSLTTRVFLVPLPGVPTKRTAPFTTHQVHDCCANSNIYVREFQPLLKSCNLASTTTAAASPPLRIWRLISITMPKLLFPPPFPPPPPTSLLVRHYACNRNLDSCGGTTWVAPCPTERRAPPPSPPSPWHKGIGCIMVGWESPVNWSFSNRRITSRYTPRPPRRRAYTVDPCVRILASSSGAWGLGSLASLAGRYVRSLSPASCILNVKNLNFPVKARTALEFPLPNVPPAGGGRQPATPARQLSL